MSRTSMFTSTLLLVLAGTASSALADATLVPGLTYTSRSGVAGTSTTEIGAASSTHAVSQLQESERWDDPCQLLVVKSDINGAGTTVLAEYDRCTTTGPIKTAGWAPTAGIHVYGIQVCTHASNDRLKGIRVVGGEIRADGTLDPVGHVAEFERTNCNTWHNLVFCPAGQVAAKVRVHHTGDTITGLSLGCREVTRL